MTLKIVSRESLMVDRPKVKIPKGFKLEEHLIQVGVQKQPDGTIHNVYEFITTGDFGEEWLERQRYEVESGRELEPLLYEPIYTTIEDANLPRNVSVFSLGPAGVIFEEITEASEVKFATVSESTRSVPIRHWAVGIEYTKDLVEFNEMWSVALVERQAGIAYNALLNHLHLYPIISATYAGAQATAAVTSPAESLPEAYLRTLEAAITAASTGGQTRRGPYILLTSTSNVFALERALRTVPQQGFDIQSSALNRIRQVIAYDGWTGVRGKKSVTYPGVSANTAYLIDTATRDLDFQSFIKQDLEPTQGNPDVSRFILEQVVWDFYRGVYSAPLNAVQKIAWPTTFSAS